jgi:hypothetical protein
MVEVMKETRGQKKIADMYVASKRKGLGNDMGWSCKLNEFMGNKRPNWVGTPGIWVFCIAHKNSREYVVVDEC